MGDFIYDLFGIRLTERQKEETLAVVLAFLLMFGLFWFGLRGCTMAPEAVESDALDSVAAGADLEIAAPELELDADLELDVAAGTIEIASDATANANLNIDQGAAVAAGSAAVVAGAADAAVEDDMAVSEEAAAVVSEEPVVSEEAAVVSEEAAVVSEEAAVVSEEAAVVVDSATEAPEPTAVPEPTAIPYTLPVVDLATSGISSALAGQAFLLNGTGVAGSEVGIVVDGETVETIQVPDSGAWEYELALPAGEHELYLTGADSAGNLMGDTQEERILFSIAKPLVAPSLNTPDGELLADSSFDLSGTGDPGSSVGIFVDGAQVDTVVVGEDGTWAYSLALSAGEHSVYAAPIDADGIAAADLQSDVLALNIVEPDTSVPPIIIGSTVAETTISLTGLADPNATVEILEDGNLIGEAVANEIGDWSFSHTTTAGEHTYEVRLPDGDPTPDSKVVIDIVEAADPTATPAPAPTATPVPASQPAPNGGDATFECTGEHGFRQGNKWIVDTCDSMSYVSDQTGISLGTLIALNPQIPNPDVIYPGQILNLP